ncbi:hypothetical protein [Rickettsia gravesii]|uniref:hypothetical protein n=1 Tax=Rickettsia gravesii TaxID=354585 RepID=UPI0004B8773F|nr:hypothetical protein [Rickettsia gravesii]
MKKDCTAIVAPINLRNGLEVECAATTERANNNLTTPIMLNNNYISNYIISKT